MTHSDVLPRLTIPSRKSWASVRTSNKAFDGVSPTVTVYDVLDRATEVTLPDESKTLTAYTTDAAAGHWLLP